MYEGYPEHYNAEARLIILKALADQHDYTLPENILVTTLEAFGINKGRDFLRNQVNWLHETANAVKTRDIASALIVTITETGINHVEGRIVLEGVKRPSAPRG